MVEYRKFITRNMLINERKKLFIFGDNIARTGFEGQAKEMRGEPNAVGIATKRYPSVSPGSFFTDNDLEAWKKYSEKSIIMLKMHNNTNGIIVWPEAGIGTGQANLKLLAPLIWNEIQKLKDSLI